MAKGEIRYPHAAEEGVTPDVEEARILKLLTPMEEELSFLEMKATIDLIKNDVPEDTSPSQTGDILSQKDNSEVQDPHQRLNLESKYAIDKGLVEARRLREINVAMAKEITDMLLGYDIELFRTPNQIQLNAIREALISAYQKDPEIDDRMKAKERINEIIDLEKKLTEYLTIFGQEVRDIINGQ
ncbi:MAG: hypothetical protein WCW66_03870 [Patescibacteria group bacterium]